MPKPKKPTTPTDPADRITLRSPAPDEMRAFMDPLVVAFGSDFNEREYDAERPLYEPERCLSAFDRDERVGSAGAFSMRIQVPGGAAVPASGITAVGVRPDHTRRGIMRRMMGWLLDDAIARGEPVAILWASEAAIYQRFGFGTATWFSHAEADLARLRFRDPLPPRDDVAIRLVDIAEAAEIFPPIYASAIRGIPGSVHRSDVRWRNLVLNDEEWARRGRGPAYRAVLEVAGEPRAYALYRIGGDWSHRGPAGEVNVIEVFGLDRESEQRLWQWLCGIDLMVRINAMRAPMPNPLQHVVQEPRRLNLQTSDALWLRILEVPAALAARTYGRAGLLVLELTDAMIDSNTGRWQLTVADDGTAVVERTSADPDLTLDIGVLARAYLGTTRWGDLAASGLVRELAPGALLRADAMFVPERTPYTNTFF